jgi:DNA-binding MarR family transcriptional regulator
MSATIIELLDEVRLLWHVLNRSGERLHRRESVTLGMRGVLEFVELRGPQTVPHIARSRSVTRQHIQGLVNALRGLGLVALEANPSHRRSALVRLTSRGRKTIARMKEREGRVLDQIGTGRDSANLRRAIVTLRTLRRALQENL